MTTKLLNLNNNYTFYCKNIIQVHAKCSWSISQIDITSNSMLLLPLPGYQYLISFSYSKPLACIPQTYSNENMHVPSNFLLHHLAFIHMIMWRCVPMILGLMTNKVSRGVANNFRRVLGLKKFLSIGQNVVQALRALQCSYFPILQLFL